jgi:hypothetical protein
MYLYVVLEVDGEEGRPAPPNVAPGKEEEEEEEEGIWPSVSRTGVVHRFASFFVRELNGRGQAPVLHSSANKEKRRRKGECVE